MKFGSIKSCVNFSFLSLVRNQPVPEVLDLFPTATRSTIRQHDPGLVRQNQEGLTCWHHQLLHHRNNYIREEPELLLSQQQDPVFNLSHFMQPEESCMMEDEGNMIVIGTDLEVNSDEFEIKTGVDVDVMWEMATYARVVEGERHGLGVTAADNIDRNLKGGCKRIDKEPIYLFWVTNATTGGGENRSSRSLEAIIWSSKHLLDVGERNDGGITTDQLPLDGEGAMGKDSRSCPCTFVDRALHSESWEHSSYPPSSDLAEVSSRLDVPNQIISSTSATVNGENNAHIGTSAEFERGLSEGNLKVVVDFILSVKCRVYNGIPECLHLLHFWVDIKYMEFTISGQDYISKSLGINDAIMVDNKLLEGDISYGLISDAYKLIEEMSHNTFTSWDVIRWLAYEDLGKNTLFEQVRLKPIEDIVSLISSVYHGFGADDGGRLPFKAMMMDVHLSYIFPCFRTVDQMFEERTAFSATIRLDKLPNMNILTRQSMTPLNLVTTNRDVGCLRNGSQRPLAATGWSPLLLYGNEMTKGKFVASLIKEQKVCSIQLLSSIYASPNQSEKALEGHPQDAMSILYQHYTELDFVVVSLPKSNDSSNENLKRI